MGGYSLVFIQIFSNNFIAIYFDRMEGADWLNSTNWIEMLSKKW